MYSIIKYLYKRLEIKFFLLFYILCFTNQILLVGQSNKINGQIVDENEQPLSYALVQVQETEKGTLTREDGTFLFILNPGNYTLKVEYIGYETIYFPFSVPSNNELKIQLKSSEVFLEEVIITSDGKDPAYHIIDKAKEKRKYFNQLEPNFTYHAYTKTRIHLLNHPKLFKISMGQQSSNKEDTNSTKILYLSENISDVTVQEPDKIKEEVIASRVSGDSERYSLFANMFLRFNIYDSFIKVGELSDRGFISPLSDQTFFYYHFKLLGTIRKEGKKLYKIQVTPKRKFDPVFEGLIWINDSTYAVSGFDFYLTKNRQIEYLDSIRIHQTSIPLGKESWKTKSIDFIFVGDILGAKFGGSSVSLLSDYHFYDKFDKKTFTNELISIDKNATKKDESYWNDNRLVPLDSLEESDYNYKDSLEVIRKSKPYMDSLTRRNARPKFSHLFREYKYYHYWKGHLLKINPPIQWINFNTTEGWNLDMKFKSRWKIKDQYTLSVNPTFRYGFSSNTFNYKCDIRFIKGAFKMGEFRSQTSSIGLTAGNYVQQFRDNHITPLLNTIYTLFTEQNFIKIYNNKYLEFHANLPLINGVKFYPKLGISKRTPLVDKSNLTWNNIENRNYTPNISFIPHTAYYFKSKIELKYKNEFITTPDGILNFGSKYPTLNLHYHYEHLNFDRTNTNFHFISPELKGKTKLRLLGNLFWTVSYGHFFKSGSLTAVNFYYPKSNQTNYRIDEYTQFHTLPYYALYSSNSYYEVHLEHHFDGLFFNKIPLLRKLKWQEIIGLHVFGSRESNFEQPYLEFGAGIENIFKVLRFDFHYSRNWFNNPQYSLYMNKDRFNITLTFSLF